MSVYLRDRLPSALALACGFKAELVPAEWEDVGGPESGPRLIGHDDYMLYSKKVEDHEQQVVVADGACVAVDFVPQWLIDQYEAWDAQAEAAADR